MKIGFNKPYFVGNELEYIRDVVRSGHLSGNGTYTKRCQDYFSNKYGFGKCLLTTSCTDALEMAAILIDIKQGDEIIMPSYAFVSTANAFVLFGAKIVFVDSSRDNPNLDISTIESLITKRTKAIIVIHYAGIACDMDIIMQIAKRYNLFVVEDAAQAIDSFYIGYNGIKKPLGSIGHFATFSFHETKNIISGEGGMLVINEKKFEKRAEIIWEKGTDRSAFFRGEVDKYGWVDVGASFLPSEIIAAILWAQLEKLDDIQKQRIANWELYYKLLKTWAVNIDIQLPIVPDYATNNGHIFYLVCISEYQRKQFIEELKKNDILSVFHYISLHKSKFYKNKHGKRKLPEADRYSNCLLRLPMYYELTESDIQRVCSNLVKIVS